MSGEMEQLLRRHGLQVTAQRLAVMNAVSSHPHATADELADDVRAVIGSISRQAVYDTLGVLVEKSLVRRIQPTNRPFFRKACKNNPSCKKLKILGGIPPPI